MYLEHFKIREFPFSLTPNTSFYCELPAHQDALNVLLVSLRSGEGFIKIIGEVGTGKTLLCRLLLKQLEANFVTAYIPNPDLTPHGLRLALAKELGLKPDVNLDQHSLLELINNKLLALRAEQKQVVLLLDEAQALSTESLEALRLLTNLETDTTKLLQVVLFGQPELDSKLQQPELRQLKQRITFSYYLPPINQKELGVYIGHRLAKAGYTYGNIFTPKACRLLYKGSRGLPRLINILSHKAMMVAYGRGEPRVSVRAVRRAIFDTEDAATPNTSDKYWLLGLGLVVLLVIAFRFYGA